MDANVKKTLVVYYSRSGFTSAVAKRVARDCNADLLSIKDVKRRRGMVGYLRSSLQAWLHLGTAIRNANFRGGYDLIVIGTPIWFWNISSPVRAFIAMHRPELKRVAFFCTCGGSGAAKVLRDLEAMCGVHPVATLALRDDEITTDMGGNRLTDFTDRLNHSVQLSTKTAAPDAVDGRTLGAPAAEPRKEWSAS